MHNVFCCFIFAENQMKLSMENPFIITGKIKPAYFCDRVKESERIIRKVTEGENVVVMAARRIGKSKLVDFCMDSPLIKDHFITISIDILRTSSINEFAFVLGKAVFEQVAKRSQKMLRQVVATLKSINGCFGYDPLTNLPTFSLSLGDISNPLYTIEEIFTCLEQAEQKCIVAIDEFQQICYYPEKNMEAILRTHIQQCSNANFIFLGSERHLISNMFSEKAHPFYNSADIMTLEVIEYDKYEEFSEKLFIEFNKKIEKNAIKRAYDMFGGNTYYIQKVMHEAFSRTDDGCEANQALIEDIVQSMVLDSDHKYSEMLSRLSLPQKELLYAIGKEEKAQQLTSSKFIKKYNLRSASSVQSALKKLVEYHFVSSSQGTYYIDDELMRLWLKA